MGEPKIFKFCFPFLNAFNGQDAHCPSAHTLTLYPLSSIIYYLSSIHYPLPSILYPLLSIIY